MNRTAFAAVALFATLALAGCAPSVSEVAAPEVPVVTPAPTQAPENGEAAPAQVFGGDCDQVLTDAQLVDIFGVTPVPTVPLDPNAVVYRPDNALIRQLGGLDCRWSDDLELATYDLRTSVVPATSIDAQDVALRGCPDDAYEPTCEFAFTAHGLTFSGALSGPNEASAAEQKLLVTELTDAFAANATTQDDYLPPIQAASAWPLDFDCSSVEGLVKAGTNNPALVYDGYGYNAYPTPVERALWGSRDTLACMWASPTTRGSTEFTYFTFSYLGGAAWAADRTGTPYEFEGVDGATTATDDTRAINIVDGVNWMYVETSPGHDAEAKATILAIIAELDSLS